MKRHQHGQSMVEFAVIVPLVLFAIFSCIQIALIFQVKTSLSFAIFQAARSAAVSGGTLDSIHTGFAIGMTPHFTHGNSAEDMWNGRQEVESQIDDGWMVFTRVNPATTAFSDFGFADAETGWQTIPNDNLMYRNAERGGQSGLSIQDANLLKVQVMYCYPVFLPLVGRFLADEAQYAERPGTRPDTMPMFTPDRPLSRRMDCRNRTGVNSIPILASAIVRMQSDALLDPAWDAQP